MSLLLEVSNKIHRPVIRVHQAVGADRRNALDNKITGLSTSLAVTGFRGQFGLGVTYDVSSKLSVGIVGRADFWSAFPGLHWTQSGIPQCAFKENGDPVCEPPQVFGFFGLGANPMLHLTAGFRLTVRTGGN